jgi:hypothetical protein
VARLVIWLLVARVLYIEVTRALAYSFDDVDLHMTLDSNGADDLHLCSHNCSNQYALRWDHVPYSISTEESIRHNKSDSWILILHLFLHDRYTL